MKEIYSDGNERVFSARDPRMRRRHRIAWLLAMAQKGMVELRGNEALALMLPFLQRREQNGRYAEQP
jgi:hypothetical protein